MPAIASKYEVHPAACIFPMMDDERLNELAADIKQNGQREPVVIWKDHLLDGRNRMKACEIAKVEVDTCEIDADDDSFNPVAYVLSVNLHRRHLTESQRAMVAARVKAIFEPAAKERQKASQIKNGKSPAVENLPPPSKARDEAGAALNVSGKTVDNAATVLKHGSADLIAAVESGKVSVSKAAKVAKSTPKREQIAEATKPGKKRAKKADAKPAPTADDPVGDIENALAVAFPGVASAHQETNIIGALRERFDAFLEQLIDGQPPHIVAVLKDHILEVAGAL